MPGLSSDRPCHLSTRIFKSTHRKLQEPPGPLKAEGLNTTSLLQKNYEAHASVCVPTASPRMARSSAWFISRKCPSRSLRVLGFQHGTFGCLSSRHPPRAPEGSAIGGLCPRGGRRPLHPDRVFPSAASGSPLPPPRPPKLSCREVASRQC